MLKPGHAGDAAMARGAAGLRQADDRAVQVSARDRVHATRCRAPRPASCSASGCARWRRTEAHERARCDPATARAGPRRRATSTASPRAARSSFVGGQIGWNAQQQFETDDFVAQARQALANVVAVLAEAGARPGAHRPDDLVRRRQARVRRELPRARRALPRVIGRHFPAMTAVEVKALIEDRAKVEIEATAIVPD